MIELSDLPSLHKLVRAGPGELEFRSPQRDFVRRGLIVWLATWLLSGPIVAGALLIAMALGFPEPTDDSILPFVALGLLCFVGFGWGLVLIGTQRHRAAKTAVTFDAQQRAIRFPRRAVPWHEVDAIVAALRGRGSRTQRLEVVLRTTGERLQVVKTPSSVMPREFELLTRRCAEVLGVAPHVSWQNDPTARTGRYSFGLTASEKLHVLLTLLPCGGLFSAFTSKPGSLVRFVALQEIVRVVATSALVLAGAALSVLVAPEPSVVQKSPLLREPALILLVCALGALAVYSLVVGLIAVVRAFDGEAWVIPGLGPIVRRWLPDERPAATLAASAGWVPPATSAGPSSALWPRATISQTAVTVLIAIGTISFSLMVCGIGTCSWHALPAHAAPPREFRNARLREFARLAEIAPGEDLKYVCAWGFFDARAGFSALTNRRVLRYDPDASPALQGMELSSMDGVELKDPGALLEQSRLIVSSRGRSLELPLGESEDDARKFVKALEAARSQAGQRR